jgi:acyl-CoA thioester hydrolase
MITLPIVVRPYDIDFAGIVNNQVYIRWLEDMRTELWEQVRGVENTLADGLLPVLVETTIQYKIPLRLGDKPVGRMWASGTTPIRIMLAAEFRTGDTVHATASHTLAIVNSQTLRPAKLPQGILKRLLTDQSG